MRGVGVGPDRNPFRRAVPGPSSRTGLTLTMATPALLERVDPAADGVIGAAALRHLRVLGIGAAEHHHEPRMARDRRPRGERAGDRLRAPEDVRQEGERGAEAVIAGLVDEAAGGGEEAAYLRRAPRGRCPAEDQPCEPPMIAAGPCARCTRVDLARDEVERALPRHRHERLAPAPGAASAAALAPALRAPSAARCAVGECTAAGIASIRREGSGSCSKGRTPTTRPPSTTALKAPQCE